MRPSVRLQHASVSDRVLAGGLHPSLYMRHFDGTVFSRFPVAFGAGPVPVVLVPVPALLLSSRRLYPRGLMLGRVVLGV